MSKGSFDLDRSAQRKTLWIVLLLNVAIALGFFTTGAFADSSALIANGLDNSSDALVYGISLLALGRAPAARRCAVRRDRKRRKQPDTHPRRGEKKMWTGQDRIALTRCRKV